jgi:hypothetical protein
MLSDYKSYINTIKYFFCKFRDDPSEVYSILVRKCYKCKNFIGVKNMCLLCKRVYHDECEHFNDVCQNCINENQIPDLEIQPTPDMSIIDDDFNVINETVYTSYSYLNQLFSEMNINLTDELINNQPSEDNSIFYLKPTPNCLEKIMNMKKYTKDFNYNGIQLFTNSNNITSVKSIEDLPKNTILGEISGVITQNQTPYCLKFGDNSEDYLFIDNSNYGNIFRFINFDEKNNNLIFKIFYWDNMYHLLVLTNKDIPKNTELKFIPINDDL